jgi:peptide/nickel transport system permease protein
MIERFVSAVLVVWTAATLAFFALDVLPGNAIASQLAQSGADASVIAERERALGLSDPAGTRYLRFLLHAVRGDFGTSLLSGEPVTEAILRSIGPTFALAVSALVIACVAGLALGMLGALHLRTISILSRSLINLALSTPIYWTGTLAIYLVTVQLKIPTGSSMALPALVLGFHTAGAIGRVMQTNVRDVLQADFIRTARAKGLSERRVIGVHVLRAAFPPVLGIIALQAGFLFSGTVITETLFVRPGIGRLLLDAVIQQDYPIVLGVVILSALIYVIVSMSAEIVLRIFDPRVTF